FDRLMHNNTWSEPWEYIRKISPQDSGSDIKYDYDYIIPVVDPSSIDLRCGRNASAAWSNPKIAVIQAGDTVGFAVNTTRWPNLYHPGPATAWLSKAPGSLNDYTGDGEWVKILGVVGRTEQSEPPNDEYYWKHQWGTYQAKSWNFTIPASTPPGDYLLRFEHIYPLPTNSLQGSQFYANCAHVKITNPSANVGTPGPTVKIPGVYTFGQKGIGNLEPKQKRRKLTGRTEIYFYADVGNETYDIRDFVEPKPIVWTG
ncbi:lytic polysaccharide monooxygenase, partial [Lentithecium fluviatile CBS 122367]